MFEALIWVAFALVGIAIFAAYDGSRDVFHPLIFIAPMMGFIYGWMPLDLFRSGSLWQYFDNDQLLFVQTLNVLGMLGFIVGCLAVGRVKRDRIVPPPPTLPEFSCRRLRIGGFLTGSVGLACWLISIINVGGFVNAFSKSYGGGWDDSGYIRDGNLLLLVGLMLVLAASAFEGFKLIHLGLASLFGLPWLLQAVLMARRGPTFALVIIVIMSVYLNRNRRPPVLAMVLGGCCLGFLAMFLVVNRSNIYLGSDFAVTADINKIQKEIDKSDTGNEFIYGTGSVVAAERRGHYFWMRRYLAQLLVRPIPSAIWPHKYEDFGVPELLNNAGTAEGIGDTLGWQGAVGSAPGIVADLWLELNWLAVVAMAALGWAYGCVWKKAVTSGFAWKSQYVILSALSMYLVMQTMEAVIFRTVLLSAPVWLVWRWALRTEPKSKQR